MRVNGLEPLLAGEHAAIYGYGLAGGVLVRAQGPPAVVAAVRTGFDAHRTTRDRLTDAIAGAGGDPPLPQAAYATPFPVHDAGSALRLVIDIEDRLCRVGAEAVGASAGADRLLAADVLSSCAVRAAQLRLLGGSPPSRVVISLPAG